MQVCFNYLQQEFYLVNTTMKTLAQGKSNKTILKLLRILINTSQANFGDLNLDDNCIRDIADVITADQPDPSADRAAAAQQQEEEQEDEEEVDQRPAADRPTFMGEEIKYQFEDTRDDGKRLAFV